LYAPGFACESGSGNAVRSGTSSNVAPGARLRTSSPAIPDGTRIGAVETEDLLLVFGVRHENDERPESGAFAIPAASVTRTRNGSPSVVAGVQDVPSAGAIVATCCNATERDVVEAHAAVAAIEAKGDARGIIQRSIPGAGDSAGWSYPATRQDPLDVRHAAQCAGSLVRCRLQ
jgi:hypothetical protein